MVTMDVLDKIGRMFLRDKLSLHEITKRTGLSRNTIRRWLRVAAQETPPTYRRVKGPGKLTEFHAALEQALKVDAHRAKQNRRTVKVLFAQIKADGYGGGYSQLTVFIRDWRGHQVKQPTAFVPLKFELGEAFQFDWGEEGLVVGGIYRRMQVSHLKLCASRAFWLVAYPSQGHEMLFDAHTRSFTALGGIPRRGRPVQKPGRSSLMLSGCQIGILIRYGNLLLPASVRDRRLWSVAQPPAARGDRLSEGREPAAQGEARRSKASFHRRRAPAVSGESEVAWP